MSDLRHLHRPYDAYDTYGGHPDDAANGWMEESDDAFTTLTILAVALFAALVLGAVVFLHGSVG